ncbi:MAG: hypothetical protein ACXABY_19820 [Candidatus Thorarchaeota archaeon]|jgi:hypothetical protein
MAQVVPHNIRTGFATTLKAPGDTTAADRNVGFKNGIAWVYTIATINTNVTMAINLSLDGSTYGKDPASEVTHTANGTYVLKYLGSAHWSALEFDAESGGTAAVITVLGAYSF